MELHEKFLYPNIRDAIFGYSPEYSDKYDLAIFLRRIVILSATFARAYCKHRICLDKKETMTARILAKIVDRPYLSIDSAVSILSVIQDADAELGELGLSELRILSDESSPDYIDLYEVKSVLQDETGKFFNAVTCRSMIERVIACVSFITETEITRDGQKIGLVFRGESFDIGDLFTYEFCYLYCTLQDVDPLKTTYIPL